MVRNVVVCCIPKLVEHVVCHCASNVVEGAVVRDVVSDLFDRVVVNILPNDLPAVVEAALPLVLGKDCIEVYICPHRCRCIVDAVGNRLV